MTSMNKILTSLFCLLIAHTSFAQNSYTQALNEFASLQFPFKPDSNKVDASKTTFKAITDSAVYLVVVDDMHNDKKFLVTPNDIERVYEGVIANMVDVLHGEVMTKESFVTQQGLKGVAIALKSKGQPNTDMYIMFKRILFVNDRLYTCNYWTLPQYKELTEHSRNQFFNSLSFKGDAQSLQQYSKDYGSKQAYNMGYGAGGLLIAFIVLAVIGGVFYFIVRAFY
jgi:uncharacterized membrane protein YeiH